jgi:hypothetical protein
VERRLAMAPLLGLLGWAGAALPQAVESTDPPSVPEAAAAAGVACLLPAEIDRLGRELTVMGARQKIETSRADCLARRGEVIEQQGTAQPPKESMRGSQ